MFSFGSSDVNPKSDPQINHGPKQDTDWFESNGTIQNMMDVTSAVKGAGQGDALSRLESIGKILMAIFG